METQTLVVDTVVVKNTVRKIKRYKNRKLYDTVNSAYINLSDLLVFIKNGEDILVINSDTNTDITAEILLRAFVDGALNQELQVSLTAVKSLIVNGL